MRFFNPLVLRVKKIKILKQDRIDFTVQILKGNSRFAPSIVGGYEKMRFFN